MIFPLFLKTTLKHYSLPRHAWASPSALNSFWKSRDLVQTVEKNLDQKYFFISAKTYFENIFRNCCFQNFHRKNQKFWKFWKSKIWDFRKFRNFRKSHFFDFQNFQNFRFFSMKFLKTKISKMFFKIIFRRDEKIFLVQIFFFCPV